jgi:hypothetical protein
MTLWRPAPRPPPRPLPARTRTRRRRRRKYLYLTYRPPRRRTRSRTPRRAPISNRSTSAKHKWSTSRERRGTTSLRCNPARRTGVPGGGSCRMKPHPPGKRNLGRLPAAGVDLDPPVFGGRIGSRSRWLLADALRPEPRDGRPHPDAPPRYPTAMPATTRPVSGPTCPAPLHTSCGCHWLVPSGCHNFCARSATLRIYCSRFGRRRKPVVCANGATAHG